MKRVLILAAMLAAGTAFADDMVYQQGGLQVRLHERPCASDTLAGVIKDAGGETPARAATIRAGRDQLQGCWSVDADRDVVVVDQRGAGGYLPLSAFRRDPGA